MPHLHDVCRDTTSHAKGPSAQQRDDASICRHNSHLRSTARAPIRLAKPSSSEVGERGLVVCLPPAMAGQELVLSVVQPATGLRVIGADGAADRGVPLATQTAPVGIIVPPPDIRSIVVCALAPEDNIRPRFELTSCNVPVRRIRQRNSWRVTARNSRSGALGTGQP
jgi:hypothetical protein